MGKVYIIAKSIYSLKSYGAEFLAFLVERLDETGFKSSIAAPDVCICPEVKPCGEN